MLYLKLFQTEQERQACVETQEYVSYTKDSNKVNIHPKALFCKLTLNNGDVVEIEGSGELTSAMTSQYSATTVSAEFGKLCTKISNKAFLGFSGLTSVIMTNNITNIADSAFRNCIRLTNIEIPESITNLSSYSFYGCSGLTSLTLTNVEVINSYCFGNCTGLTSIILPVNVLNITSNAFNGCSNLTSITSLALTAPRISTNTFNNVKSNGTLYVPNGSSGYENWIGIYLPQNWTKVEQ